MKRVGKPVFFVTAAAIAAICCLAFFGADITNGDIIVTKIKGIDDIRWGMDIGGGASVTLSPPNSAGGEQLAAVGTVVRKRLAALGLTDGRCYVDGDKNRVIARFSCSDKADAAETAAKLGSAARFTVREGLELDSLGLPAGATLKNVLLTSADVVSASAVYTHPEGGGSVYMLQLELNGDAADRFGEATSRLIGGTVSVWLDDTLISAPEVRERAGGGPVSIPLDYDLAGAVELADMINGGELPFALAVESIDELPPVLGVGIKERIPRILGAVFLAAASAMAAVYRLSGVAAAFALAGQLALTTAFITGFFAGLPAVVMTLFGVAGAVTAFFITAFGYALSAERIKRELCGGRSTEAAVASGLKKTFRAVIYPHAAAIAVSAVLAGIFKPSAALYDGMLSPLAGAVGQIYSFGYALLSGAVSGLIMWAAAFRLMLCSLSRFQALRGPALYGAKADR